MVFRNHLKLLDDNQDPNFRESFAEAFSLSVFFKQSIKCPDYRPQKPLSKAIGLTTEGIKWEQNLKSKFPDLSEAERRLALFMVFYHQELFIDIQQTSVEKVREILNADILGNRVRFPWVYSRVLYDKYFNEWPEQTEELPYEETAKLIANTPQGVFQLRSFLVGPFGILASSTLRSLPPKRLIPLWHCSDPSCNALHSVRLSRGKCCVAEAVSHLLTELDKLDEQSSDWGRFYSDFDGSPDWYEDLHLANLPWLLANCFSTKELQKLLTMVIQEGSKSLRARFPTSERFKPLLSGSASDISSRVDKAQCLQLLLLADDTEIAKSLEVLVDQGKIHIPWTEVRTAMLSPRPIGWFLLKCEFSRFGVRSRSMRAELPLARLKKLLRDAYSSSDDLAQLEWHLRHIDGSSVYEKLNRYVHTTSPLSVVSNLLLAHPKFLKKAFDFLRHGYFPFPVSPENENYVVNKILWKLGFDTPHFPPHQDALWDRLEALLKASRTSTAYTEADRENIRSAAVNFFVSIEEILDLSLSFICWVLLADHYGVTKFRWNPDEAREFMTKHLNGKARGSGQPIQYDPSGKNTLFPLIQGFALVADICDKLIADDPPEFHRSSGNIPKYAECTELDLFPFAHTALIMDVRQRDREQIVALLREITSSFESPDICELRNRLEHRRKDFPTQDEIEDACKRLSKILNKMECAGVCPLVYFCSDVKSDAYGRKECSFIDYRGRTYTLFQPSQYILVNFPMGWQAIVLVPWLHVGESLDIVRFSIQESSDFFKMWRNYPKKRSRLPTTTRESEKTPIMDCTFLSEGAPSDEK